MSYLLHATKRRNRNPLKKIVIVLFLSLVLGIVARNVIINTVVYMGNGVGGVLSFFIPGGLRTNHEILQENNSLREQLMSLTAQNIDRNILADENANLKFLLGRRDGSTSTKTIQKSKSILAIIKSGPAETPFDTFIVDVGSVNGVAIGDKVYYGNLIIGKVVDVGDMFAKIELFSSPGNVFSGVMSGSKIKIDAKGVGGGVFEVLVPQGVTVKLGDALVLPSISTKIFGVIKSIEDKQDEGFKRLLFTLPINPSQITSVLIEK